MSSASFILNARQSSGAIPHAPGSLAGGESAAAVEAPEEAATFVEALIESSTSKEAEGGLLQYCTRRDKLILAVALVLLLLTYTSLGFYNSLFGKIIFNLVNGQWHNFYIYIGIIIGLAVGGFVLQGVATWAQTRVALRSATAIKERIMLGLMEANVQWGSTACGKLPSLVDDISRNVNEGLGIQLSRIAQSVCSIVCNIGVGFYHDIPLTLCFVGVFFAMIPMAFCSTHHESRYNKELMAANAEGMAVPEEVFYSYKPVVSYSLQAYMSDKFLEHLDEVHKIQRKLSRFVGLGHVGRNLLSGLNFLIYGVLTMEFIWRNPAKAEDYLSCFMVTFGLAFSLLPLGNSITAVTKARASLKLAWAALKSAEEAAEPRSGKPSDIHGGIEYHNVTFSYDPTKCVLKDLSFKIEPGEFVAFVGPSGSGKSTITSLLCRLLEIDGTNFKGKISLDGIDADDFRIPRLREQIALVNPDVRLFTGTIMDNIKIGNLHASDEEAVDAAKKAQADKFIILLPDGYNTMCGPAMSVLSGGQKQRIAIARAFLRRPKILLLDEATSALDNVSEKAFIKSLEQLIKELKCTTISIAHRLSIVRNCDRIYVLGQHPDGEGAHIVEFGTHHELIDAKGHYYELIQADSNLRRELEEESSEDSVSSISEHLLEPEAEPEPVHLARKRGKPRDGTKPFVKKGLVKALMPKSLTGTAGSKSAPAAGKSGRPGPSGVPGVARQEPGAGAVEEEDDDAESEAESSTSERFMRILNIVRELCPWTFYTAMFSAVASGMLPVILGFLFGDIANVMGKVTDRAFQEEESKRIYIVSGITIFVGCIVTYWAWCYGNRMVAEARRYLESSIFKHVLSKDVAYFDVPDNNPGRLVKVMATDVAQSAEWIGEPMVIYAQLLTGFVGGTAMAMYASWLMALIALGCWSLTLPIVHWCFNRFDPDEVAKREGVASESLKSTVILTEAVDNVLSIHMFTIEHHLMGRYYAVLKEELTRNYKYCIGAGILSYATGFLPYFLEAVLLCCCKEVLEAELTTPQKALNAIYTIGYIVWNFSSAASTIGVWKVGANSSIEMEDILDDTSFEDINRLAVTFDDNRKPGGGRRTRTVMSQLVIEELEFRDVAFCYPTRPDAPVYNKVSFKITKGQVAAFVGPSGCGKSTGIQLIQRFYDLLENGGDILVNGKSIREIPLMTLRASMAVVFQEPTLFYDTIEENIAIGAVDCTPSLMDIHDAAILANANDFVCRLPNGYQFNVGPRGRFLSSGQKQRIAIARALVRKPSVLILDEATSALDSKSERAVQASIDNLIFEQPVGGGENDGPNIVLMIAHRLSTVQRADLLIVLSNEEGRGSVVVQLGNHETLSQQEGVYRSLLRAAQ